MYAVVGCSDCSALWVVADRPDTTECPRCGRRHQFDRLKRFAETEESETAREARAALLAERADQSEAFANVDTTVADDAAALGVDPAEHMAAGGVDPEAVAEAGERAEEGRAAGGSAGSRREILLAAVDELDEPTVAAVEAYAAERGVDRDAVGRALAKLARAGEVSESGGTYRRL